ncbi:Holliday junction resolvase RuvX [candidate division KSB1 bacterium]|nr:Holliday junction resolvase RuvX [candidate division KSB1 bacterium]TDI83449.1 MAG: Holliday junction resolvase RuvX [Caldithrix sp.]TDI94248.1 MAG: Holliday junction resolvase RuvX [Caldithrix sp.]TDI97732.1 MAG: Holliday junction resolvase RuvX [Caldithrix sp.]
MQGRILGIDYGKKRIGLAVSDPMRKIAQGLPTLTNSNLAQVFTDLENIISEHEIKKIVIGLPITMKAEVGKAAQVTNKFVTALKDRFELPTMVWDERLTSVLARRTMRELGKSPSKNKNKVDEIAAILILQSYLDSIPHSFKD